MEKRLVLAKKNEEIDYLHLLALNIKRGYRKKKIRSSDHMAFLTDIPARTISRLAKGEGGNPRLQTLIKIAKALDMTVPELFKGKEF